MKKGIIKVKAGGMRCGKTDEMNRVVKRTRISNMKHLVFKPSNDTRFSVSEAISRAGSSVECIPIPSDKPEEIENIINKIDVEIIFIDETQFFKPRLKKTEYEGEEITILHHPIVDVVERISDSGISVYIYGLDMDSDRNPFGAMPLLLSKANEVQKLHAVCEICHNEAQYSYANFTKDGQFALGDENYISVCPNCYRHLNQNKDTIEVKIENHEDYREVKIINNHIAKVIE